MRVPPPPPPPPARCENLRATHRRVLQVPTPARSSHCQRQQEVVPQRQTQTMLQNQTAEPHDEIYEASPCWPSAAEPEDAAQVSDSDSPPSDEEHATSGNRSSTPSLHSEGSLVDRSIVESSGELDSATSPISSTIALDGGNTDAADVYIPAPTEHSLLRHTTYLALLEQEQLQRSVSIIVPEGIQSDRLVAFYYENVQYNICIPEGYQVNDQVQIIVPKTPPLQPNKEMARVRGVDGFGDFSSIWQHLRHSPMACQMPHMDVEQAQLRLKGEFPIWYSYFAQRCTPSVSQRIISFLMKRKAFHGALKHEEYLQRQNFYQQLRGRNRAPLLAFMQEEEEGLQD